MEADRERSERDAVLPLGSCLSRAQEEVMRSTEDRLPAPSPHCVWSVAGLRLLCPDTYLLDYHALEAPE